MNIKQVKETMKNMNFVESSFDQYEKEAACNTSFFTCQTSLNENNLNKFLPSVIGSKDVKKYYIVELSGNRKDIRVWTYNIC